MMRGTNPSTRYGFRPLWYQDRGPPKGTYGLLIAIGVVFILQLLVDAFRPALHNYIFTVDVDWPSRPWSVVTAIFAHGGFSHIFFNGLFLYFFGPSVETILGRGRYLILWFVAGIISSIGQAELPGILTALTGRLFPSGPSLGASGALMALLGFSLILLPKTKMVIFPVPVPVPLWVGGTIFALLDLLGLFNPASNVGHAAHLAGLAAGLAYGIYVKKRIKRAGLRLAYA